MLADSQTDERLDCTFGIDHSVEKAAVVVMDNLEHHSLVPNCLAKEHSSLTGQVQVQEVEAEVAASYSIRVAAAIVSVEEVGDSSCVAVAEPQALEVDQVDIR